MNFELPQIFDPLDAPAELVVRDQQWVSAGPAVLLPAIGEPPVQPLAALPLTMPPVTPAR